MEKKNITTKDLTLTAMMAALVFLGTYIFKISTPTGYIHLGDCIILITVCLFGTKKGAVAGALGAGLADLMGGYFIWFFPTLIIKSIWALIMGGMMYKLMKNRKAGWLVGAILGGIWQIIGYTAASIPIFSWRAALLSVPALTVQTASGVVLCVVIYGLLVKSGIVQKIRVQFP